MALNSTRRGARVAHTASRRLTDSMLASVADPQRAPEMLSVSEAVRGWRFYDHFRSDSDAPARVAQVGTFTPILHHDGSNLAAALQTILEIRPDEALAETIEDAFPGSRLQIDVSQSDASSAQLHQYGGLLRPLSATEVSDGTLMVFVVDSRWVLTSRPPELMALNEPETSLHPDLLPALARLVLRAAKNTQIIVVSHAPLLIETLVSEPNLYASASGKVFWRDRLYRERLCSIHQSGAGLPR